MHGIALKKHIAWNIKLPIVHMWQKWWKIEHFYF